MDCPSAQPEMSNARVLGIIETGSTNRQLSYVNEPLSVSSGLIKAYKLHNLSDKVRFSATCEESKCTHFDGDKCMLASRIVDKLPMVSKSLPPCLIRKTCRWFSQEGKSACFRCPQIQTYVESPDDAVKQIAGSTNSS